MAIFFISYISRLVLGLVFYSYGIYIQILNSCRSNKLLFMCTSILCHVIFVLSCFFQFNFYIRFKKCILTLMVCLHFWYNLRMIFFPVYFYYNNSADYMFTFPDIYFKDNVLIVIWNFWHRCILFFVFFVIKYYTGFHRSQSRNHFYVHWM